MAVYYRPIHCRFKCQSSICLPFILKNIRKLSSTRTEMEDKVTGSSSFYDVVISGGGMVGTAMATALGTSPQMANKKVLLLEAQPLKSGLDLPSEYSNRVSALSVATKAFMEDVGAWNYVSEMRYRDVKQMRVWDGCSDAAITFNLFTDHGEEEGNVAYLVENGIVSKAFVNRLETLKDRVKVVDGVRVRKYELSQGDLVKVHLEGGEIIETELLIGSDGAKSMVRKEANIKTIGWNYDQMAIVATLHLSEAMNNIVAWQRFLPTSTIALLPLTDSLSSLVWSTEIDHAKELLSMSEEAFVDEVNSALWTESKLNRNVARLTRTFGTVLKRLMSRRSSSVVQLPPNVIGIDSNSRASYLLSLGHATQYVAPRVALIGDAAHRIHPHAGQGANLGFGDVRCLLRIVEEAISCGSDLGMLTHLLRYECQRQREVLPIMAAIDGLHRLFTTDVTPVVAARGLALQFVNSCHPVKEFFMKNVN